MKKPNLQSLSSLRIGVLSLSFALSALMVATFQNCAPANQSAEIEDLSSLSTGNVETVDPTLPEHSGDNNGHGATARKADITTYNFEVMNKFQILSHLQYVFGPQIGDLLEIEKTLLNNYSHFGGQCGLYEALSYKDPATGRIVQETPLIRNCDIASLSNTPTAPPLGTTREALMDKICARAVNTLDPVYYALRLVDSRNNTMFLAPLDEDPTSGTTSVTARNAALGKAFRLFYATQPDPMQVAPNLIESLRFFFADPAHPRIEEWQGVLYTICISPYWQVL